MSKYYLGFYFEAAKKPGTAAYEAYVSGIHFEVLVRAHIAPWAEMSAHELRERLVAHV